MSILSQEIGIICNIFLKFSVAVYPDRQLNSTQTFPHPPQQCDGEKNQEKGKTLSLR